MGGDAAVSNTHTPGPWHIDGDRGRIYATAAADNGEVPICQLLHDRDDADRSSADARLIACAPDLLSWLEKALPWVKAAEDLSDDRDNLRELRALQKEARTLLGMIRDREDEG
jgi:hypothetical protein